VHTPSAPDLLFEAEVRDGAWAPAMEAALTRAFAAPAVLARLGLAEMVVSGVTCRQTT
jgi:hypothetical protein